MVPFSPYDGVAGFYDAYWGDDFTRGVRRSIEEHVIPLLPEHACVLDLCCGTGLLARHLAACGFHISGVDESANMLAAAERNAPGIVLQQADMADFRFTEPFAAVVCLYNSLNHTTSPDHLRRTLRNVAAHLQPGGLFVFDHVPVDVYEQAWQASEQLQAGDQRTTIEYHYDPSSRRATCLVNQRYPLHQRAVDFTEVHEALGYAGLVPLDEFPLPECPPAGRCLVLTRRQ